jgi:hypothetical protein
MINSFHDEQPFEMKFTSVGKNRAVVSQTVPKELVNNLLGKRMYCTSLYINNLDLPLFIPEQGSEMKLTRALEEAQFMAQQTTSQLFTSGVNYTVNSIDYYICISTASKISLRCLQLIPEDGVTPPYQPHTDKISYCTDKYYWCHDFEHFLTNLENTITNSLEDLGFVSQSADSPICKIITDGKSCELYIMEEFSNQVSIVMSDTLIDILPFNKTKSQYFKDGQTLNNTNLTTTLYNSIYDNFSTDFYDTIYPFEALILQSSDFPVRYAPLSTSLATAIQYSKSFLQFLILGKDLTNCYNYFNYGVQTPIPYVYFTQDTVSEKATFTVQVFARMKNDVLIPIDLKNNERFIVRFKIETL